MEPPDGTAEGSGSEAEFQNGVRSVELNLPEDAGEGLGFQLTRTLWDPYPWVREVTAESRADAAGLKPGDCLLQVDGQDLLGIPVGKVAGLIRGDGDSRVVSMLAWNCGVDPTEDPELLWSCGGGARGERARRVVARALSALACAVCAAAPAPRSCRRQHLYCRACWSRLERCALCREPLPPPDSPAARNRLAEQVFEAIATEYGIKNTLKRTTGSVSAQVSPLLSPRGSPHPSPAPARRGQYQLSLHGKQKKSVQFTDRRSVNYASDPNIHRSSSSTDTRNSPARKDASTSTEARTSGQAGGAAGSAPHRQVALLRQAASLLDLQSPAAGAGQPARSLSNIHILGDTCPSSISGHHSCSLDNLKSVEYLNQDTPVFILPAPPIYLLSCNHEKTQ